VRRVQVVSFLLSPDFSEQKKMIPELSQALRFTEKDTQNVQEMVSGYSQKNDDSNRQGFASLW